MKCIILGLGNFGAAIAMKLTELGHDVIGVDTNLNKVNAFKDSITYAVCLDSSNLEALLTLPVQEVDLAIVAIGEDFGASVMTTALLKQLKVKRLICRAISPLHEAVFNAIEVDGIVHPEQETAERLAHRLHLSGVNDSFHVTDNTLIIKANVPEELVGLTVKETSFQSEHIQLITVLKTEKKINLLGKKASSLIDTQNVTDKTRFESGDILVLYGSWSKLRDFLNL